MGVDLGSDRSRQRIDRAAGAVLQAHRDISGWLDARRGDDRFIRFGNHFRILDGVLGRMLAALAGRVDSLRELGDSGPSYDGCRSVETMLTVVRRTFDWYRERYDQRCDERLGPILLAADELVRSCWSQPFAALRLAAPTGPLAYVDPRFNAFAVTRSSVPTPLRPPARTDAVDEAVRALLRELPIPVIALPEWATRQAWWLAPAAHETGHHVQRDLLPGLPDRTRAELDRAVRAAPGGDAELAAQWSGWQAEVFADAFSAVMIADAAAWAVDELEHAAPTRLAALSPPGHPYPPPLVRRALLGELVRRVRGEGPAARHPAPVVATTAVPAPAAPASPAATPAGVLTSVAQAEAWLAETGAAGPAAAELRRHLAVVPAVAEALLTLPVGATTLLAAAGVDPAWFAPGGRIASWARALRSDPVPISPHARRSRPAARLAVQAGVAAHLVAADGQLDGLHRRLAALLRTCGEPGVLAPAPPPGDVDALATGLTTWLLAHGEAVSADAELSADAGMPAGVTGAGGAASMKVR
ncbi:hypothetical protein [Frankia sp. QA3]|uniref:hypothetical protein n=1 Tax=Frankia sp. QA3 TaxID=710111 RepID=UPI000269C765|nr:hypothetical protein [Frankia sp. QA3]EIV93626.1 hypothetical protein FraQA3DRAFT_3337 [Frankia sp. QA3]